MAAAEAVVPQIQTRAGDAEYAFIGSYVKGDIKKDHPQGFADGIADHIIAINPSRAGVPPVMGKEDLLDSLITLTVNGEQGRTNNIYNTLQVLPANTRGEIKLNLFNPACKYRFQVFDRNNDIENKEAIRQATLQGWPDTTSIILTSDTTNHKERILTTETPIHEKYSRESEWDPAKRTEAGKCVENYISNPTGVLYPKYEGDFTDKLSYLFLKYDIHLVRKKYKVHLEYISEGKPKRVDGDSNTAGLILQLVNKATRCFNDGDNNYITLDDIESRYIGKYCGDGCLRISQFRNTILNQGDAQQCKERTFEYGMQLNETLDGNYFTGLLAAQSDAIWFHTNHINGKRRLIVFSKVIDRQGYNNERLRMLSTKLYKDLKTFSDNISNYDNNMYKISEKLKFFTDYHFTQKTSRDTVKQAYVNVLKDFTKYSILYDKYLEIRKKFIEMFIKAGEHANILRNIQQQLSNVTEESPSNPLGSIINEENSNETKIKKLEKIQSDIYPYLRMNIDKSWVSSLFKPNGTLQDVTIEDLVIKKITASHGVGWKVTYESVFNTITLECDSYKPSLSQRVSRFFMSKNTSAWGLDIIKKVYGILKEISTPVDNSIGGGASASPSSRALHTEFITELRNTLDTSVQTEFDTRMQSIDIPVPTTPLTQGGGRYKHKKTYNSKKRLRKTTKVYKQRGGAFEKGNLIQELKEHLHFLNEFFKAEEDQRVHQTSVGTGVARGVAISSAEGTGMSNSPGDVKIVKLVESTFGNYSGIKRTRSNINLGNSEVTKKDKSRNSYEYKMDFLEFYKDILKGDNNLIIILLNRYRIMNYINKNSFSDIEESIKKIRVGDMPDPMRNAEITNDSIIKILTKEVTTEAIDKVINNIIAIRVICKKDILTDAEYIDITADIDGHLGEAHEFLKVAEVAYEAEKEYFSSRYEPAIQYLQEVLTLYPVVVVTGAAGASTPEENADYASQPPNQSVRTGFFTPSRPVRPVDPRFSQTSTVAGPSVETDSAPPDSAPPAALSMEVGSDDSYNVSGAHASGASEVESIVENDRSATKIFLDGLNLSLMGKLKYTMDAIRDTMNKSVSNVPMGGNSRPTPAGGASARRLTFNTGSNRRNQTPRRKTQRKPRR